MNESDYNAAEGVRWSRLKAMRVSPKQYQYELKNPRADSAALLVGRAIHTIVLEGMEAYRNRAVVFGGKTRQGKAWDEFREAHKGREILSTAEDELARACAEAVLEDPIAKRHLRHGIAEKVIQWKDEETGILCKCRVDLVNGHLVELKSTRDPDPDSFARDAHRFGYHGQIAFYHDGVVASGYELEQPPALITVGTKPPHDVVVLKVSEYEIEAGQNLYRPLLVELAECLERDEWPGIARGRELSFRLPPWAQDADEPAINYSGLETD